MKRSRLRNVSTKRAAEQRERRAMLQRDHGPVRCHFPGGCTAEAVDAHEVLTRGRGGSISDPDNVLPLCRTHHDWIGDHPTEALDLGLLRSAYTEVGPGVYAPDVPKQPTKPIPVRVSDDGLAFADGLVAETGRNRSEVFRALFAIGSQHRAAVVARLTRKEPTP